MELGGIARSIQKTIANNSSLILTTIGVTGTIATAFLAGKASFKAAEILNEEKSTHPEDSEPAELQDQIKLVWKEYIPAAASAALTVAAIIGVNRVGTRKAAALASAYSISEKAFTEYKNKVKAKIGATKEQAVRDEVAQDQVTQNPPVMREVIITGGKNESMFHDSWSGQYFMSSIDTVNKAVNSINYQLNNDYSATLTDFYHELGLPATVGSDAVGWNSDRLLEVRTVAVVYEDKPVLSIEYVTRPTERYSFSH